MKTLQALTRRNMTQLYDRSKIQLPTRKLLINNEWVDSVSGQELIANDPYFERAITTVQRASKEDARLAIKSARKAFDQGHYPRMSPKSRANLLLKLADLIEKNIDDLAALESLNNGKTFSDARNGDLPMVVNLFRYYGGLAEKIHGKTIPIMGGHFCFTREEPVGVCGLITPWNYPLVIAAMKLGPALAAGCTTILKPAEQTPLSSLRLGELILEAGFPEGVVNILSGFGDVGDALVTHPEVDKISFTGSTEVGRQILAKNGHPNIKRITLELGGKSANIILDDADIESALLLAHAGVFGNQGQSCNAGTRVYVHSKIYDEFVERSVKLAKERVLGDPFSAETTQGPQINAVQQKKIHEYIKSGIEQNAKLLTGKNLYEGKGYFVNPAVFVDVNEKMKIAQEEIFGPVMSILRFDNDAEVIQRANSSHYGLAAGVFGKDFGRVNRIAKALRAGSVYINCYDVFQHATPFGGFKDSGIGRELGKHGLIPYLETKTVVFKE